MTSGKALLRLLIKLRRLLRNDHLLLAVVAIAVGLLVGGGEIVFRAGIALVQTVAFGFGSERVHSLAAQLSWWHVLLAPALGGLMIGLFIHRFLPGGRPQGVPHVMEAAALLGGRMPLRTGIAAAAASAASIGVGASVGREGPVVHLGASLASWVARQMRLSPGLTRTLLGCGVASAVAASFNAPMAGVLFALEVVVGNYALSAFAPIVLASVAGTVLSRFYYGPNPAFVLPPSEIRSVLEFPAFLMLGILSGLLAVALIRSIFLVEDTMTRYAPRARLPRWSWPALGGLAVGALAVPFPHILGVGYEATDLALQGALPFGLLAALVVAKLAATAVSLGSGFAGGIFSPALFLGAVAGGAFGHLATAALPELSSGPGVYAMVGMGAVAGATLGAPISTILIIFEMTNDYPVTLAVMVGVVTAGLITNELTGHSFFSWQLRRRGVDLRSGQALSLLNMTRVGDLMVRDIVAVPPDAPLGRVAEALRTAPAGQVAVTGSDGCLLGTIGAADFAAALARTDAPTAADILCADPPLLEASDTLRTAMQMLERSAVAQVPVVDGRESRRIIGIVQARAVIQAYHRTLLNAYAGEARRKPAETDPPGR